MRNESPWLVSSIGLTDCTRHLGMRHESTKASCIKRTDEKGDPNELSHSFFFFFVTARGTRVGYLAEWDEGEFRP